MGQERHLTLLQGRLHEINDGLSDLLRRHDLEVATRAIECRKRHVRLAQKALALATKTQVLRNRGYAMDAAEEELRQRLVVLEKATVDAAVVGRQEEIWARMVRVRESGWALEAEFRKAGGLVVAKGEDGTVVDEAVLKSAKKVRLDLFSPP